MNLALAILGPTASGKSDFALELATKCHGEIVCMDSTTVYQGFDIGSAKPSTEDQQKVPHHLLDLLEPEAAFSAFHFVLEAERKISEIQMRGNIPIVVGGTYFYLKALQHGMYPQSVIPNEIIEEVEREYYEEDQLNTQKMHQTLRAKDPEAASKIHPNDRYRLLRALAILRSTGELPSQLKPEHLSDRQKNRIWLKYALSLPRHTLTTRIATRTHSLLDKGLVNETQTLANKYPLARALNSIGYAEACQYLRKQLTEKQLQNQIVEKTRHLAKRQITWLRSDPEIRYINHSDIRQVSHDVDNLKFVLEN